jgi:hypothetical protein
MTCRTLVPPDGHRLVHLRAPPKLGPTVPVSASAIRTAKNAIGRRALGMPRVGQVGGADAEFDVEERAKGVAR